MATKPRSIEVLQRAVDALSIYRTQTAAARELGIARQTLQGQLAEAEAKGIKASEQALKVARVESEDELHKKRAAEAADRISDPEKARLQADNAELRKRLKDITKENLEAESVRAAIFGLTEETPAPPDWLVEPRRSDRSLTGVPSVLWSDWHIGEVVRRDEVNGVNEYNLTIADARIRRLVERTVDLCFSHMTNPEYPGIVVNLLGDLVSGELHPELEATDESEVFLTVLWARDRLIWALRTLADRFGNVFVACAFGNHGRVFDRKPRGKRYVYRNADWLICCLVERYFREQGDNRVQFSIPATGEALYSVYGHRYMGLHGDDLGVRGGDGIIGAIGPIMRGEIKVHNSSAQIERDYDTLLMGHWHQTLWLPRAIVNNTLKGYDEYARRFLRAPATPPSQNLWFTHPKWGITARWEVLVEGSQRTSDRPWVSWEDMASEGRAGA